LSLLAFFIAAALLALTPGPGIAYVVARTVAGGRQEGLASCLGTGLGGMLHVLAAALGFSAPAKNWVGSGLAGQAVAAAEEIQQQKPHGEIEGGK